MTTTSPTTLSTTSTVAIRRRGREIIVEPSRPTLTSKLTTRSCRYAQDDAGRCRVRTDFQPAYQCGSDGSWLRCPAGFEPVVRQLLRANEIVSYEVPPLPAVAISTNQDLGPVPQAIRDRLDRTFELLIRYKPGTSMARLIAQIALAYPQVRIGVLGTNVAEIKRLRRELEPFIPDISTVFSRSRPRDIGRIVLGTPLYLAESDGMDLANIEILVVLDAVQATRGDAFTCVQRAKRARLIGLLATDQRPAPSEMDLIRTMVGFEEVRIPEQDITVAWLSFKVPVNLPPWPDALTAKREAIWNHEARNRLLVDVTRAIAAGEQHPLLPSIPVTTPVPRPTILHVESVEHGINVARMTGWPVIAGTNLNLTTLDETDRELLRGTVTTDGTQTFNTIRGGLQAPGGNPPVAIATTAGLATIKEPVDVVVRADAGPGVPRALEEFLRRPAARSLLVDLADQHHPMAKDWARQRRREYKARGWYDVGADPVQIRVQDFLNTRSQRS